MTGPGWEDKLKRLNGRVVLCGLAKNCGDRVYDNIQRCKAVGEWFEDYQIIIYENNSTDNTKELLQVARTELQGHLTACCCTRWDTDEEMGADATMRRAHYMRGLRDFYLHIVKAYYNDYDWMVVLDFDIANWSPDVVVDVILEHADFDCISANGLHDIKTGVYYYDLWSLVSVEGNLLNTSKLPPFKGDKLISVSSGFGGLAIYDIKSILDSTYLCDVALEGSDHVGLHYNMILKGFTKHFICPRLKVVR